MRLLVVRLKNMKEKRHLRGLNNDEFHAFNSLKVTTRLDSHLGVTELTEWM